MSTTQHILESFLSCPELHSFSKGQLISKQHFVFSNLQKKKERKISAQVGWGKTLIFQVRVLEELKTSERYFEIN